MFLTSIVVATTINLDDAYCKDNVTYPSVLSYSIKLIDQNNLLPPSLQSQNDIDAQLVRGQNGYAQIIAVFSDEVPNDWVPAIKYHITCNLLTKDPNGATGLEVVSKCTESFCDLYPDNSVTFGQSDQFQVPIETGACEASASLIWIKKSTNIYCRGWKTENGTVNTINTHTYGVIDEYSYNLQNQLKEAQDELKKLKNQPKNDLISDLIFPVLVGASILVLGWFGRKKIEPLVISWLERGIFYKDQNLAISKIGSDQTCKLEELRNNNGNVVKIILENIELVKHTDPQKNFFNMKSKTLKDNCILRMSGLQEKFFVGRYRSETISNTLRFEKVELMIEIREIKEYPRSGTFIETVLIQGRDLVGNGGRGTL